MATYSFLDTSLAISGPGGSFTIGGDGTSAAEEGFTIEPIGEKNTMTESADGDVMHSLHATKTGKLTVRLLKTSPYNRVISQLYNFQTTSSASHGQNVITARDVARGDVASGRKVAFAKQTSVTYAKLGGNQEWEFHIGVLDLLLGSGAPALG